MTCKKLFVKIISSKIKSHGNMTINLNQDLYKNASIFGEAALRISFRFGQKK